MKVIQTIQSTNAFPPYNREPPVEVTYYTGDSLAQAISAASDAAAQSEHEDHYFRVLAVRIDIADVEV